MTHTTYFHLVRAFATSLLACGYICDSAANTSTCLAAVVYHVARAHSGASDQNPGTADRPFKTIARGCQSANPGDTIVLHGGQYYERVVLNRGGTPDAPIVLKGAEGEAAIICGRSVQVPNECGLVDMQRVANVTLENLEIRNSPQDGIRVLDSARVTIRRVSVHHSGRSGMMLTECRKRSDTQVVQCDVHDNRLAGIAIWNNRGGYFTVRGNRVYHNLGLSNWDGIQVVDTPFVAVLDNIVYDNAPQEGRPEGDQIDAGGTNALTSSSHHVIYERNSVYGRGGGVKMNNEPLYGIIRHNVLFDTVLVFYEGPTKIAVYHNTVLDGPHALQFWGDGRSMSFGGTQVKNNLFVDARSYAVNIGNRAVPTAESICMDHDLYRFRDANSRGINVNAPAFDATFPPTTSGLVQFFKKTGQEQHGRVVTQGRETMFVDVHSRDVRLAPGSAAIDAGGPLTTVVAQIEPALVHVGNAWYFQDGWNGLLRPDTIRLGNKDVTIVAIDYQRHEIRVDRAVDAQPGTAVSLPYRGPAPDAGAYEFGR